MQQGWMQGWMQGWKRQGRRVKLAGSLGAVALVLAGACTMGRITAPAAHQAREGATATTAQHGGRGSTATPAPTPTPTAAPISPLADAQILTGGFCLNSYGQGCTGSIGSFYAPGPFVLVWMCDATPGTGSGSAQAVQVQIFSASGRQADVISEACPNPSGDSAGIVSEPLPAGEYSITMVQAGGPPWVLAVMYLTPGGAGI